MPRSAKIEVRLSPQDKALALERAAELEVTVSELVRRLLLASTSEKQVALGTVSENRDGPPRRKADGAVVLRGRTSEPSRASSNTGGGYRCPVEGCRFTPLSPKSTCNKHGRVVVPA